MILNNLNIVGRNSDKYAIEIKEQMIVKILKGESLNKSDEIINFENVLAFPGIINSHDHLEFNLFPELGNKKYQDYIEWGEDIHQKDNETIEEVLKIPVDLRIKFGIYKNLLCGITTIIHHGINFNSFKDEVIDIKIGGTVLHSVQLEKKWKLKLNNPLNLKKILIHISEGINEKSKKEVDKLLKWNFLKKNLIGIHAISMDEKQANIFDAVVWCPYSNIFLYGKTANIKTIKNNTKILFGTDSTVSANWNFWEHLKLAKKTNSMDDKELFNSFTKNPAEVFNLKNYGELKEDYFADIIIAKKKSESMWDAFFSINPEDIVLILKRGKIILYDKEILPFIKNINCDTFYKFQFNNKIKFVAEDINASIEKVKCYSNGIKIPFAD